MTVVVVIVVYLLCCVHQFVWMLQYKNVIKILIKILVKRFYLCKMVYLQLNKESFYSSISSTTYLFTCGCLSDN